LTNREIFESRNL